MKTNAMLQMKIQQACDPHIWLDPHNVMLWTAQIRDTLSENLPAHAEEFAANADAYLAELRDLDASISEQLQMIPPPRLLVTQHDILGYFAARYDFERDSVLQNFSSLSEANPAELAMLLDRLRDRGRTSDLRRGATAESVSGADCQMNCACRSCRSMVAA